MIGRLKFDIDVLVKEMLDQLPESVWTSTDTTFLDPCMGGGQFVAEIERRLIAQGHAPENVAQRVYGFENNLMRVNYAINKHKLVGTYRALNFLEAEVQKKFDVIVGNPPYQASGTSGNQQKTYNAFCKNAVQQANDFVLMVTPTGVLKGTKRFSLPDQPGLKHVDFTTDKWFDVGVKVCSWMIDVNNFSTQVEVIDANGIRTISRDDMIVDSAQVDPEFSNLYAKLKLFTKKPKDRMFVQNPVDSNSGKSDSQTDVFKYPIFKIENSEPVLVAYHKPVPKYKDEVKFTISITKSMTPESTYVGIKNFTAFHVSVPVENYDEVDNIMSFIFSDYFKEFSSNCKIVDGYGFNNCLVHLPKFDKTRPWTNEEVREFIESFSA